MVLLPRRARAGALDVAHGQMAHHAVVDLQHARDLVERLGARLEDDEVVVRVGLVVDLEGEPPPSPRVVAAPRAPAALDEVAHARDDLALALLGGLGVEHQQNLVRNQAPEHLLPTV